MLAFAVGTVLYCADIICFVSCKEFLDILLQLNQKKPSSFRASHNANVTKAMGKGNLVKWLAYRSSKQEEVILF